MLISTAGIHSRTSYCTRLTFSLLELACAPLDPLKHSRPSPCKRVPDPWTNPSLWLAGSYRPGQNRLRSSVNHFQRRAEHSGGCCMKCCFNSSPAIFPTRCVSTSCLAWSFHFHVVSCRLSMWNLMWYRPVQLWSARVVIQSWLAPCEDGHHITDC